MRVKEPVFTERELLRSCNTDEQRSAMIMACQYVGLRRFKSNASMMWRNPRSVYSDDVDPDNPSHWDALGT